MSIQNNRTWSKWMQRRILSIMATTEGCVVVVVGLILTVNTILYVMLGPCVFTAMLDIMGVPKWPHPSTRGLCPRAGWKDNIGGVDVSHRTSFGPIDVVYTWVNGSDPRWLRKKAYWKAIETNQPPPVGSSPDGSFKNRVRLHDHRRLIGNYDDNFDEYRGSPFAYASDYGYGSSYGQEYGGPMGDPYYSSGYGERRFMDDYHALDYVQDDMFEESNSTTIITNSSYLPYNHSSTANHTNASILNTTLHEEPDGETEKDDADADNRYRDSNELLYSLRSLEKYAPWVRHIYLVTDNQIPSWLNMDNPRLTVIPHTDIFPNKSHLPVFSSPAIEAHLHRISGLSQRFAYFNDDVFLGAPTWPEDFIGLDGSQKVYLSWDVPKCNDGCPDSWLGDGHCDKACNVSRCNFDYPDCVNKTEGDDMGSRRKNRKNKKESSKPKVKPTTCAKSCADNWLADKVCDNRCNNAQCAYDAGDCGLDKVMREFPSAILIAHNHTNASGAENLAVLASSLDRLPGLHASESNRSAHTVLSVPYGTLAGFLNFSQMFPQSNETVPWSIKHAVLEDPNKIVQNSVVLQRHSALVFLFHNQGMYNPQPLDGSRFPATAVVTLLGVQEVEGVEVDSKAVRFRVEVTENTTLPSNSSHELLQTHEEPSKFEVEGYASHCAPTDFKANITHRHLELSTQHADNGLEVFIHSTDSLFSGFNHSDGSIMIRQSLGVPPHITYSTPHISSFRGLTAWGVGHSHTLPPPLQPQPTALRVLIPDHWLPNASTSDPSPWITLKVDVVSVSRKLSQRLCSEVNGNWETGLCILSRWTCVEAVIRIAPVSKRRRLSTTALKRTSKSIRIVDDFQESSDRIRLRGYRKIKASRKRDTLESSELLEDDWLKSRVEWWMNMVQQLDSRRSDRRRLLDTFGDSLIFVNQLYNKRFGPEVGMRKVPAHMPHFIDREVLAGLQEAYAEEFDATSQHRFRSSTDMQYSFAYFYWLQNTKNNQDLVWDSLWYDELDVDHNGYLDENELLTLTSMAHGKEPTESDVDGMRNCLTTAVEKLRVEGKSFKPKSHSFADRIQEGWGHLLGYPEHTESTEYIYVTLEAVLECPLAVNGLRKHARKPPTFEKITQLTEVAFEMIGDDFNRTRDQLNSIRARKTKFVCVNDDMKHPTAEMVAFLQDFYLSFFPFPSQFELPPNVRNHILHYDRWKQSTRTRHVLYGLIFLTVIIGVFIARMYSIPSLEVDTASPTPSSIPPHPRGKKKQQKQK